MMKSEELYNNKRYETEMGRIFRRKLQLFGHVCRMLDSWLLKILMLEMVEGQQQPERLIRWWVDDILMWCNKDLDLEGAAIMTEDRDN